MQDTAGEAGTSSSVMYSYGPPHMAGKKQDDQLEHTYSSYVRIRDVVLKTCRGGWTIGRKSERGSGISVLATWHDDDDDCERCKYYKYFKHVFYFLTTETVPLLIHNLTHWKNYLNEDSIRVPFSLLFNRFLKRKDSNSFRSKSTEYWPKSSEYWLSYWTGPSSNTPQGANCTATYHLSRELYKLDEPDIPDTAGEARTRS